MWQRANTSEYLAVSIAVTCAPLRLSSCATRVVPVKRSSAVRAPERSKRSPRTGTRRRFEPRYLITAPSPLRPVEPTAGWRRTPVREAVEQGPGVVVHHQGRTVLGQEEALFD